MSAIFAWGGNSQSASSVPVGTTVSISWTFRLVSGCGSISVSVMIPSPAILLNVGSITDSYSVQSNRVVFSSYGCWQNGKLIDGIGGSINPDIGMGIIYVTSYTPVTLWFTSNFSPCMGIMCGTSPAVTWYGQQTGGGSTGGGSTGGSQPPDPPYVPPPQPPDPPPPPPPPPIPREVVVQVLEDTTSINMDFIAITKGDAFEKGTDNTIPEIDTNVLDYISMSHIGPKITPLKVTGTYTLTVHNISDQPIIKNILIDISSNLDENLFKKIWQMNPSIFTNDGKIFIPELRDTFEFEMDFLHDEEIEFEVIFTVFDEIELYRMPVKIKDIPYLILNIDGPTDVDLNEEFELTYSIRNISGLDAHNITTKIDIPKQFSVLDSEGLPINNNTLYWYHDLIESDGPEPSITIKLIGRGKGSYRFHFEITDGDVFPNETWHTVDVGIYPITKIVGIVDKRIVEIGDDILLTIDVINKLKISKDTYLKIDLDDYDLEDYDLDTGMYDISSNIWYIGDIGIDQTHRLILTLKSTSLGKKEINIEGYHMNDKLFDKETIYTEVVERTPKFIFEVTTDSNFVYFDDEFCFNIKIGNIENIEILNGILKGLFPPEFEITRSTHKDYDFNTHTLNIDSIGVDEVIEFKICGKINVKGEYTMIFTFKADDTQLQYRIINLICSDVYIEETRKHTIKIFDFDKLNKYYYQYMDRDDNLNKEFTYDDRSIRLVEREKYVADDAEIFEGNNLRAIVNEINDKSKYVTGKFIRKGLNVIDSDKRYLINPDGFIHRFGLLKSDIYHRLGIIPKITNMSDYVMHYNVDNWKEKVYGGDIWDSGVFQVGMMYTDIPSNFEIPSNEEIQSIINKAKAYGLKAIPQYMAKERFKFKFDANVTKKQIGTKIKFDPIRIKSPYYKINIYRWDYEQMKDVLIKHIFSPIEFKMRLKFMAKIKKIDNGAKFDKIRLKPIKVKNFVNVSKKQYININDYQKCISSDNLININLQKDVILDDALRVYYNPISLTLPNNPMISFNNAPKYGIQKLFLGNDTMVFKLDSDLVNNTEFGVYFSDISKTIRFCRNKDDTSGQDGIKISEMIGGIENILYTNVLDDSRYIYLKLEKINDLILFYYSLDGETFEYIKEFIMDFDFTQQGLYAMNKNTNLNEQISYTCYEYREMNTNHLSVKQTISNDTKVITTKSKDIEEIPNQLLWENFKYINKDDGSYAKCENKENYPQQISPLIISFDNININDLEHIEDIRFKVKMQCNSGLDAKTSILLNGNQYDDNSDNSQIKYPKTSKNIKTVTNDLSWNNIQGVLDNRLEDSYCYNYFNATNTDWIELSNFNFNINNKTKSVYLNIEGANESNSNIDCRVQMISESQKSTIHVINGILPGNFEKTIKISDVFTLENINDQKFGFRIQFLNIKRNSKVLLSRVQSNIIYEGESLKPEFNHQEDISIDPSEYSQWILLDNKNMWKLNNDKPHSLRGSDIKNGVFGFIDFGILSPNERIKLYGIDLTIYYKNTCGKFISDNISGNILKNGTKNKITFIDNKIDDPEKCSFGSDISTDKIVLNQDRYTTRVIDGVRKEGIDLKEEVYQQFEATSTSLSGIELQTQKPSGKPSKYIKLEIYENNVSNRPGKLLKQQFIEGWTSVNFGNTKYDLFIENLTIGQKYWIKFSLPKYDKYNYYIIRYAEGNVYEKGTVLVRENGTLSQVNYGSASLAFKLYTQQPLRSLSKYPIFDVGSNDIKIMNRLKRKNPDGKIKSYDMKLNYGEIIE